MIRLKCQDLEYDFPLSPGDVTDLTIENPSFYRAFVNDIRGEDQDQIVISDDGAIIDLHKHLISITDLFELDPNSKKVLTAIYKKIDGSTLSGERKAKFDEINAKIEELLKDISSDFDGTVIFNDGLALPQLLGELDFKFDFDDSTFLSSFVSYIKAWREAMDLKVIVTINLFSLLDQKDVASLSKELSYLGLSVLNVSYVCEKISGIKNVIVDKDLCEIF
jgi:CRISPR type II-A-associated protein Csn2